MSSCLVLQAKDKLYIGADTSSSVFIDDKLYRLNNKTKKLFLLNANTVLYCAGNNSIAEKVVQHISSVYCRNDFSLISLKNWLIEMYPYKNKDKTVYDVEILIATFKNNKTIVYQMSQYKNYDIISFDICDTGVQILSAGIKNAECMSFAENELLNKSGVKTIFRTTFNNLSCNYIGGCLDLYEITKNGAVKIFDSERINEHGIQYAHDVFNDLSVSLNAEVLVSKLVMSENLWIENPSGTFKIDDSGLSATNGINTIKIQPNNSGELFSIYKGNSKQLYFTSDGDAVFSGSLKSASGTFSGLISGGSINLGNGTFTVDKNGNMYASSGTFSGDISGSSGTFGGVTIDSNGLSSNQFSIDSNGNASFSGTLSATSITSSGALNDYLTSSDLANAGSTTINGDNITTGTIRGTNSEFTNVKFLEKVYYRYKWGGQMYDYQIFNVNQLGILDFCGCGVHVNFGGSWLFKDSRVYLRSMTQENQIATIGDIPDVPDTSNFITGIQVTASGQSGNSGYTKNYFLRVSSSGTYKKVGASQIHVSDRRLKRDITIAKDITNAYMRLTPVHFRYKENVDGVDGHWHYGFIAQDVKQAFIDAGIYSENEALVGRCVEDDTWLLDKDELHAMHTQMIQKQQKEIESLKKEFASLEQKVNQLIN